MSFSYDPATVSTNPIHEVRFLTGQTDPVTSQIEDEEIQYLLDKNNGDVQAAANDVMLSLLKKASHAYDKTTGEVSESLSQWYDNLKDLVDDPSAGDIELAIPTPIGMHAGGLDSEEFALRNADRTVYQGFTTCDANPWDIGTENVDGVNTSEINGDGKTTSTDQDLDQP